MHIYSCQQNRGKLVQACKHDACLLDTASLTRAAWQAARETPLRLRPLSYLNSTLS
jgi:hypothetical protein